MLSINMDDVINVINSIKTQRVLRNTVFMLI